MAFVEIGNKTEYVTSEFVIDTVDDVASLPTCHPGSSAICPSAGVVYMVNASGEWVEFGAEG